MSDLWRNLRVGDKVRVVEWPKEMHKETLHQETRELYDWLIDTKSALTITKIDNFGLPQGEIHRIVHDDEQTEFLLLNHGGLEIVEETGLACY